MIDTKQKRELILLMLISPLFGLFALLKSKNEKVLLFFGVFFFGMIGSIYVYEPGSDGHTHLMHTINEYMNMSLGVFFSQFYEIITFEITNGTKDIYLHCISFVSAAVFSIPELIHVFAGLILGYFFTKSVLLILKDKLLVKKSAILIAFIILFLAYKSLGALNSIRMWTGMWVFFYGTLSYVSTKRKKYLLVILFSIIVHFSYAVILIPFTIIYFFKKRTLIVSIFYLISFGAATISFASIEGFIPKTSLLEGQQQANVISSEKDAGRFAERADRGQEHLSKTNFYKRYGTAFFISKVIVGLSFILLFFFNSKNADTRFNFLVATGLGLYSFSNLVNFSPSLSGRLKVIASVFLLAATIHLMLTLENYNLQKKKIQWLNKGLIVFLVASIPMVLFQISYIINMMSFFGVFFPQISWFLGDNDFTIKEGIVSLF
jgi:hypothetical protein